MLEQPLVGGSAIFLPGCVLVLGLVLKLFAVY